ncbi:MAG: cadherin-like domain-containing protein [Nitrospira sp.]|nr:cadherin-like domain-containing protein [Nitrospira sp.]
MLEPLEGRVLLAADLTGLVTAHTLADPSVPTNVETATVQVKNQGTTAASASTQVRVYASTDSTFSTSDVLLGTTTTTALTAGQSRAVTVNLTMPNTLAAGAYKLLTRVDATNVVAEGTAGEANNVATGPSFNVAWQFGTVPGRSGNTTLTLRDADGTAMTFKLTGPGVGTVIKDGTNWDLKLTGTMATSAVIITTSGGNGRATLNDIHAVGPLASFTASTTDVNGALAINGAVTTLTIGDLTGSLAAKSITTFTARNLTEASLYIGTTLGQDGKLGGTGTNADTYGLGRLQDFVVTGAMMAGSTVRVGVNPVDGIFGNGNDRFISGSPTGIGTIKIQGSLSADSRFVAATIPSTYLLAGRSVPTTGDAHFVTNLNNQPPIAGNDTFTVKKGGILSESASLVKDIWTGSTASGPSNFVNVNGMLFFTADNGVNGQELWKSDGTAAGTVLVKDIVAGFTGSNPQYLTNVNGTLFFLAETAANGRELWKSDGTAAGTVMVKDINPGSGYGFPNSSWHTGSLTNVNGTLFFTADNGVNGIELWKSNGTAAGTVLVKDIYPGSSTSSPSLLTSFKGMLFFVAYDVQTGYQLWKSDGTAAGTQVVRTFYSIWPQATYLKVVNETLFFTADDGVSRTELWKTDGTAAGTVLVKDIAVGYGRHSYPSNLTNVNGTLFFTADNGVNGVELWKSNGTAAGTVLVKDITPGNDFTYFSDLTSVGNQLFFRNNSTYELWKSDGTAAGTIALAPGGMALPDRANGSPLITDVNGVAYFRASNYDLWKSDGTVAGTMRVMPGANTRELANVNGTLFFSGEQVSTGRELMKIGKVTVLANDRDPESAPLTAALVSGTTNGTLTFNANGTFTYRPNAGFTGTDRFTYRANDGLASSNVATVSITVTA